MFPPRIFLLKTNQNPRKHAKLDFKRFIRPLFFNDLGKIFDVLDNSKPGRLGYTKFKVQQIANIFETLIKNKNTTKRFFCSVSFKGRKFYDERFGPD